VRWHHLALLIAPLIACSVDATLTLLGQPTAYWDGNGATARELSPAPLRLLSISLWLFALAVIGWNAAVGYLLDWSPRIVAIAISTTVTIGHVAGSASWIMWATSSGDQKTMALTLLCGIVLAAGIAVSERHEVRHRVSSVQVLPVVADRTLYWLLLAAIAWVLLMPYRTTPRTENSYAHFSGSR
jgi:hypothetical protein